MTNEQILELAKTCEFDYHKNGDIKVEKVIIKYTGTAGKTNS